MTNEELQQQLIEIEMKRAQIALMSAQLDAVRNNPKPSLTDQVIGTGLDIGFTFVKWFVMGIVIILAFGLMLAFGKG